LGDFDRGGRGGGRGAILAHIGEIKYSFKLA